MRRVWGILVIVALVGVGLWALADLNGGRLPGLDELTSQGTSQGTEQSGGQSGGQGGDDSPAPSPAPPAEQPDPWDEGVATPALPADAGTAVVRYVHDGDTLFLEDGRKVRLLGVDTPEVGDGAECYGDEARSALRRMLPEGTTVRTVADVRPLDQYDRSLLFLFTEDGRLVNLDLIREGYAEAVVLKPNYLWADEVEAAEDEAQTARVGMWGACVR
ncbi:thermonuclease family protein [Salinibacterium sp. ZJ70]|uniref:thermonuclease family protein n=1 Tax=Salinibacterium sp. ZJ70 TaxID=2708084 RepID=UPI001421A615|nr:thermonuclease family protein [Salinibacterium sp. ZJ70]